MNFVFSFTCKCDRQSRDLTEKKQSNNQYTLVYLVKLVYWVTDYPKKNRQFF